MRIAILVFTALIFFSCDKSKKVTEVTSAESSIQSIVFERDRCRGTCKEFKLQITSAGILVLEAGVYMPQEGKFGKNIDVKNAAQLFQNIERCTVDMSNNYVPNVSDFQGVRLKINKDGQTRVIEGMNNVPQCYVEIIRTLDSLSVSSNWK